MRRLFGFICITLVIPCLLSGCKNKEEIVTADNNTANTSMIKETMASQFVDESGQQTTVQNQTETDSVTTETTVTDDLPENKIDEVKNDSTDNNIKTAGKSTMIETYHENNIAIQYPVITQLDDNSKKQAVNDLLKINALSILSAHEINRETDQVSIDCKIVSMDRNRLTAIYTGSYQTSEMNDKNQVFYTNTVDLSKVCSVGFNDYADPYTMAGYLLSDDCVYYQTSKQKAEQLNQLKLNHDIWHYTEMFKGADFTSTPSFPNTFSYENQGTLYFSIPVSHELGDYALVVYQVDTGK